MTRTITSAAVLAAALLALPGGAIAKKPEQSPKAKQEAKAQKRADKQARKDGKVANFVFKGVYVGDGAVEVAKANGKAKRHFVGQTLTFDFTAAKLKVADVDGDGAVTLADVQAGDKVIVKVRAPRSYDGSAVVPARQLVDQTHPAVDEEEEDEAPEAPAASEAPEASEAPAADAEPALG